MKTERHRKILEIIKEYSVGTQGELTVLLSEAGIQTVQATVSRDIRELRLQKTASDGGYRYTAPEDADIELDDRLSTIFRESVVSVDCAGNIVVVKTLSGLASAAFAAIDAMRIPRIVGTLAGDDTGFVVVTDAAAAESLCAGLSRLMK